MKYNSVTLDKDERNIYLTLGVKSSRIGRMFLLIGTSLIFLFLVCFCYHLTTVVFRFKNLFPIAGVSTFLFFALKSYLWNTYGEEYVVINNKSISYSYYFGFIHTKMITISYNDIEVDFQIIQGDENGQVGKLLFSNYKESDGLPEIIYTSSVLIDEAVACYIIREIDQLKSKDKNKFQNSFSNNFSLN